MTVVAGVVALPATPALPALQALRSGDADPRYRLFAKWGLVIHAGRSFTLSVPPRLADVAGIGWGRTSTTPELVVPSCRAGSARWFAFAGGYWVAHPLCLPVRVTSAGRSDTAYIGVGIACPGQDPPPRR